MAVNAFTCINIDNFSKLQRISQPSLESNATSSGSIRVNEAHIFPPKKTKARLTYRIYLS